MIDIHVVVSKEQQVMASRGIAPTEYDVKAVGSNEFLGVIETTDLGFMFTDTFGHLTMFDDTVSITEVFRDVFDLFNPPVTN